LEADTRASVTWRVSPAAANAGVSQSPAATSPIAGNLERQDGVVRVLHLTPASSELDVAMPIIEYLSVEAQDAQTKRWVRHIGAILPRSTFSCFLSVDVARLGKLSQIAAARGLLTRKRFALADFHFKRCCNEQCGVQFRCVRVFSSDRRAPVHSHSEFKAGRRPTPPITTQFRIAAEWRDVPRRDSCTAAINRSLWADLPAQHQEPSDKISSNKPPPGWERRRLLFMRSHGRDYRRMVKKRLAVAPAFDAIS
jgi:hypothetical protein